MVGVKMSSVNPGKYLKAPRIPGFKAPIHQLKTTGFNIGGGKPHPSNKIAPVKEVDPAKKAKLPKFSKGGAVKKSGGCMR
jgi:hypothetical protein